MGSLMVVLTFAVKHNYNVFCVENAFQWDHFLSRLVFVWSCFTWLCSRVMRFQSRPTNWPLLTMESPVAQVVRASD